MQQHMPGDVVNGHRLSEDGTRWEPVAAAAPTAAPARTSRRQMALLFVILTAVATGAVSLLSAVSPKAEAADDGQVAHQVQLRGAEVWSPSSLKVLWTVVDDPGQELECMVEARDPSGTYKGWDFVTFTMPEDRTSYMGYTYLTITNEGAAFVTDVDVRC